MRKNWNLTQASFDLLLQWLDEDQEKAGQKYQQIRERLTKIFVCRGCVNAEDLADETINRVAAKIPEISPDYVGSKYNYFHAVAQNVFKESLRRKEISTDNFFLPTIEKEETADPKFDCLENCLAKLPSKQCDLILHYYEAEKSVKIANRQGLAEKFQLNINALRIKIFRIRAVLKICIENCLGEK